MNIENQFLMKVRDASFIQTKIVLLDD